MRPRAAALRAVAAGVAAFCAAAACALRTAPPAALAQHARTAGIDLVSVGFDTRVRLGTWAPVWVDVVAAGADVDGAVIIESSPPAGGAVVRFGAPVRAASGATVRVFVPAIFFDARQPGTVHLEAAGRRLASLPLPRIRGADEVVVVLSDTPLGAEAAAARTGRLDVVYVAPEALPRVWQAYASVRLLVVRRLDERRLDDDQRMALRDWLWSGGRLLVMPAGDDVRHLNGPTLGPLRPSAPGRPSGRGQVMWWTQDAAEPAMRSDPVQAKRWDDALAIEPRAPGPTLDAAVPAGRAVPVRTHVVIGALVFLYVLAIRRTSRWLASLRLIPLLAAVALVAAATGGAACLAAVARRDASGAVSATAIEVIPGTGHALLSIAGRVVSAHGGPFAMSAPRGMLLRPDPTAPVTLLFGERTQISGRGTGVQFSGSAVVPAAMTGVYETRGGHAVASVHNRSGRPLEGAWIYAARRVQRVASIRETAEIVLDETRWQAADRLPRTEENHALLAWAFTRLEADAILKSAPAWLVGWWRDPALAPTWNGRAQTPLQLVLVPLAAPR